MKSQYEKKASHNNIKYELINYGEIKNPCGNRGYTQMRTCYEHTKQKYEKYFD